MRDIYRFVVLHKSCHSHFAGRSSVPWKEWWPWETLICEVQVWVDSVERMRVFGSFLCPRVNIWFWMHKWITDKESPKGIEKWSGFIWFPWILAGVRVWYTICRNPEIEFWLKKIGFNKENIFKKHHRELFILPFHWVHDEKCDELLTQQNHCAIACQRYQHFRTL